MSQFIVNGGNKLKGSITVNSAKNSAVSILCASLMIKGDVVLKDMPRIQEVFRILEILESVGVRIKWIDDHTLYLNTANELKMKNINRLACENTRSSLLFLGALSSREKKYILYKTGGCKLGERTVRPHLYALEKIGVNVKSESKHYQVENKNLKGCNIVMYESGDTPTENAIMAAVLADGTTTIKFASSNYMVQDLCCFLNKAGAKIKGIGTTTLTIEGVKNLKPVKDYPIMPDPIVAMTYLSIGITTSSQITVKNCPLEFLELELCKLEVMGQKFIIQNKRKSKNGYFDIVDIEIFPSKLIALPDKIYGRPFPGLNIDNLSLFVPILACAKGRTLVHDWAYENRAVYYLELQKLGAKITLLDPHRVFVEGPTKFFGNTLICPPAIRPAMAILVAMIASKGTSFLINPYPIERGYENLVESLSKIGVKIKLQ